MRMNRNMRSFLAIASILCWVSVLSGCTRIAVAPSCPEELEVGEASAPQALGFLLVSFESRLRRRQDHLSRAAIQGQRISGAHR